MPVSNSKIRRIRTTFRFLPGHIILTTPDAEREKLPVHLYKVIKRELGDKCDKCAFFRGRFSAAQTGCILSELEKRFYTGYCARTFRKVPVYFQIVEEENVPTYKSLATTIK